MKKFYSVRVFGESESYFMEYYTEEEIAIIEKFFNDMIKYDVASYDVPLVEFENDGKIITVPNYGEVAELWF